MKEKATKLLSVKSIVTIIMTLIFAYLAVKGIVTGTEFLTIFTVVIGFYFGTQTNKVNNQEEGEKGNE